MTSSDQPYPIKKAILTDADFDELSWHDNFVHAIAWDSDSYNCSGETELLFDIDYILEWVHPSNQNDKNHQFYRFWIAPSTLVFRNVSQFEADITWLYGNDILWIAREPLDSNSLEESVFLWTVQLATGKMTFQATGFTQYLRQQPHYSTDSSQHLSLKRRGGFSFDKTAVDLP